MDPLLTIKNLSLSIADRKLIDNATFTVNEGDIVLLTGPNGCGKSTLIKMIMNDATGEFQRNSDSDILYHSTSILNEKSHEKFRKEVSYISQEDEFESDSILDCFVNTICYYEMEANPQQYIFRFIKEFSIQDCFNFGNLNLGACWKSRVKKWGLDPDQMDDEDKKIIDLLNRKIKKLSGGQKKLAHIFSILVRYEFSDLLIFDEPLNNLDYNNVRNFSNILTKIYKRKPRLGILLVTHCRSIPLINRVLEINPQSKKICEGQRFHCSSCFGPLDDEGFYR